LKGGAAPLRDLNDWRDEGIAFSTRDVGGHQDDVPWSDNELYAPDVAVKDGKYYLYAQIVGAPCAVAVSDNPAGPFRLISRIEAPKGAPADFGGWSQYFDPGVLVDDDGKVYLYWGGGRSFMAELNPASMRDVLAETYREDVIPKGPPFDFQEASSPRKINGIYYLVFASGPKLVYATSKSPTGPFAFGGTIVRNDRDYPGGNIHGSLVNLDGQWYVTYHRMTHATVYSRKVCVERVKI
jgi:beta-xylosidase